jgi:hypothetical protein
MKTQINTVFLFLSLFTNLALLYALHLEFTQKKDLNPIEISEIMQNNKFVIKDYSLYIDDSTITFTHKLKIANQ